MVTRYQRIAASLRDNIISGELPPGSQLPTERELVANWGVTTPTVRQAVDELRGEGLVEKIRGVGTFVSQQRPRLTYSSGPPEIALSPNLALNTRVERSLVPAEGTVPSLLGVESGTQVTRYLYTSTHEGTPYVVATVFVPGAVNFMPPFERPSPWGCDYRDRLSASGARLVSTDRVTARPSSADETDTLGLTVRSPVLVITRTTTDADGRVVEAALVVLPGDRADAEYATHAWHTTDEPLEGAR